MWRVGKRQFRYYTQSFVLGGFLFSLVASFLSPIVAQAQSTNVQIGVGDTTVQVNGTTSPGALVTILDGGSVIGSATANAQGEFTQLLTNQAPGIRAFSFFAEDTMGRLSDTVTVTTNVQEHFQTSVDVFLPPIVRLIQTEVKQGGRIIVEGSTAPNATVVINIDNTTYATVTTDSSGNWTYSIDTTNLAPGQHWISAVASKSSVQSHSSQQRSFTVAAADSAPTVPPPVNPLPQVSAPRPPTITSPKPGEVVVGDSVEVVGTAEASTQIEVWNRDELVGSVFADANGNWRLRISLNEAANSLKARACRADVCSDFSTTIPFTWQSGDGTGPIVFLDKYRQEAYQDDELVILATIRGGQRPYQISVDWGDGTIDKSTTGNLESRLLHWYKQPGERNGVVTVTDADGRRALAHFSVRVLSKPETGVRGWMVVITGVLILGLVFRFVRYVRLHMHREPRS